MARRRTKLAEAADGPTVDTSVPSVPVEQQVGSYFMSVDREVAFIPSGSTLLDCALGGGWAQSRIVNIVGDKSTSKTGLAMEALINFALKYPDEQAQYIETESAFDKGYAKAMGLPLERVAFPNDGGTDGKLNIATVEDLYEWCDAYLDKRDGSKPGIIVVDSLDALSDRAEIERDIDEGTFGAAKAKKMSELFRRLNQRLARSQLTVQIVSQVRDKIGITFGRSTSRSGGRALDFYASQVVYLAKKQTLKRTRRGVERAIGVVVKIQVDKNKVSLPGREVEIRYMFGWGIDDVTSCLEWLVDVGRQEELGLPASKTAADKEIAKMARGFDSYDPEFEECVRATTKRVWCEIEENFVPKRRKYA